ncbi:hypothetical protein AZA_30817 [Nitrospirillum viridazoti Y2]|nr:hypothetical protein AZA_30817 [Nitrospirillum amazonense Y2]
MLPDGMAGTRGKMPPRAPWGLVERVEDLKLETVQSPTQGAVLPAPRRCRRQPGDRGRLGVFGEGARG